MLHVIVRAYIEFMQNHLHAQFKIVLMSAIYILGVYHKHTICFIGHENYAIKCFPLHKLSYFLLPVW